MTTARRPWEEELAIVDHTMRAISGVVDPDELVDVYWTNISQLIQIGDYVALSRRNVEPPDYLVTRSSRFTEYFNPWTQRDRLPRLRGGLLGEIAFANQPVIIDDLPARLRDDDPGHFYLQGFGSLVALPLYDQGEALNVTVMLSPPDKMIDRSIIPMMHWQSGLFGRGTQNLVLRNQLETALGALDRELQVVGQIQRSLLPDELPPIEGLELAAHYVTSARAGGDYYDFFPLDGGAWGIFIADVSGHGTPAAVLMAITHALAHARPGAHTPPAALLTYLNEQLARLYTRDGTFVTAFYAVLEPRARTLNYALAGHNPPRLARGSRILALGEGSGLPLGLFDDQSYGQAKITLQAGDLLLLYTDGITEAMAPASRSPGRPRDLFGLERLDRVLLDCDAIHPDECIQRVRSQVQAFCEGAPPNDDQTLIAIRCLPRRDV